MHSTSLSAAALLLAGLQVVSAQTFTDCNPLDKTCPSDAALGTTLNTDWTTGASSDWSLAAGTTLSYGANGAEFTINKAAEAPTISSDKYIFFGKVDAVIKAAPGVGIVSSFILESDDLDEIDWEWLGANDASVESNFFGKGNTTTYDRAVYHNVADPIGTWHTYTVDWTSESIKWSIDGNVLRTLSYSDALALGGQNYPQTPMKVKIGNWVGCADAAANQPSSSTYGTCQWAGGPADFTKAPFTMYVKSVTIQDYSCGSEYTYGDTSGSYQSIKISGSCNGNTVSSGAGSSSSSGTTSSAAGGVFAQTSSGSLSGSSTVSSGSSTASSGSSSASSGSSSATSGTSSATKSSSVATTITTATSSGPAKSTSGSGTATTSSGSSTTSNSPSTITSSAASTVTPKSKFGALDAAVIALGLTLGYFVM